MDLSLAYGQRVGNKLQLDQSRSLMVCSFTFLELGQRAVSDGSGWLTPLCVRTRRISEVTHFPKLWASNKSGAAANKRHRRQAVLSGIAAEFVLLCGTAAQLGTSFC